MIDDFKRETDRVTSGEVTKEDMELLAVYGNFKFLSLDSLQLDIDLHGKKMGFESTEAHYDHGMFQI